MASDAPMTIELAHDKAPRDSVITSFRGWIECASGDMGRRFLGTGEFRLSDLDPRIDQGSSSITRYRASDTRFELNVHGPVTVDGRPLNIGDRVRITTGGGEITWSR
jgi:hypothetical protein